MKKILISLLPVVGSFITAVVALVIVRQYFSYENSLNDTGAWAVFYNVFGVLYAIVSGFLLVEVLSTYNKLSGYIEEEINALQDVRDFSLYLKFQPEIRKSISKQLASYARSVASREWLQMSKFKDGQTDTTNELYNILTAINTVEVTDETEGYALQILMEKMSNITTFRTKRLSISHQRLPTRLKYLMIFMSLILILGLTLLSVESMVVHLIMVLSMTLSIHLLYLVIIDLDNPFKGVWALDGKPFLDFAQGVLPKMNAKAHSLGKTSQKNVDGRKKR